MRETKTRLSQTGGWLSAMLVLAGSVVLAQDPVKVAPPAMPMHDGQGGAFKATNFQDVKWEKMLPELGADSPEISILRVDPKTQATQLLIRTPTAIHVPKHWHSANETHTVISGTATFECGDERVAQGPGSFNYMPSRMVHQAWTSAGHVLFITVDGPWDIHWVEGPPSRSDLGVTPPLTPTGRTEKMK